jgi:hypothetical protein
MKKSEITISKKSSIEQTTFELLEGTGTNWSVYKEPLISIKGHPTESYGIFKNDNNDWLGTTKGQYVPFQNHALAQTIVEASSGIGSVYRGGTLQDNRKVFYQIQLPDFKIENDTIKRWLTAINSHDGSTSIGFGSSNTVVVCQNTFYRAFRDLEKFRHTMSAAQRVEVAKLQLMNTLQGDNKIMEDYSRMAESKISKPIFEKVIKLLFDVDKLEINSSDVSTRKKNQLTQFNNVLESELNSHGNSLWGLFNSVTYFENHIRVNEDKKNDSIFIGGGNKVMNSTFDSIMEFINKNTVKHHVVG